ncbi:MAG: SPOR domain-containing protein [Undibacterium sp.]|nr:SPOR domain-containing protein [Undibacterium sp.]
MLRFLFWIFLIINALFLAANFGWLDRLGDFSLEKHEPHRLKAQKSPERLTLMSESTALALVEASNKKAAALAKIACIDLGNFTPAESKTVEIKLQELALGKRQTRTEISEVASNMVYLSSLGSKDAAEKKAAQLHKLGIEDFYIVQDQTPLRWGISLGVFKTPEAAKVHLANLSKKGLKDAKIAARPVNASKFTYRFLDVTPDEKSTIEKIKAAYASVTVAECKP